MKKITTTIIAVCAVISMSNAQLFLGGSVNFATTGGKTKTQPTTGSTVTVDDNKTYNTTFAPKIGLLLSEKLAVGTNLIVGNSINNNPNNNTSTYTGTLGIAPFARYYAVKGEKFKIFAEAELGLTRSADRVTNNGTSTKGDVRIARGLNVSPNFAYAVTPKLDLEARVNFLNFNISSDVTKKEFPNGDLQKTTSNSANFTVDANNILTTGFITIGATYKLWAK
mgnify:FL=1